MNLDDAELEALCKQIREWAFTDFPGLMAFVHANWAYADWGWKETPEDGGTRYHVSTAGWSDNEALMGALQENFLFWAQHWEVARRGGHYEFFIRSNKADQDG